MGTALINNLMYADDLVILAPSHVGLSMLLSVCSDYGLEHDIKFNSATGLDIKLLDAVARGASRFENLLAPLKTYWPPQKTNCPLPRVHFITLSMHHSHHTSNIEHHAFHAIVNRPSSY